MQKIILIILACLIISCSSSDDYVPIETDANTNLDIVDNDTTIDLNTYFTVDFNDLPDYANQNIPNYITKDNMPADNSITDEGAVLGRILFYDTNLSVDNTISCASCHKQVFAFGDNIISVGVGGMTGRHSMRLINARFSDESNFFWDERASSLENQTTMPIHDHIEMGYSGENGDPNFDDLITKLENVAYYSDLFTMVYGDSQITEDRMQRALAQFIRSIQSFDSKYDQGVSQVANPNQNFPNYTQAENNGKSLFMRAPDFDDQGMRIGGGIGCMVCHRAPEFDIRPTSGNNGVIGVFNSTDQDITITRSPSLRDVVNSDGIPNGTFFHDSSAATLEEVLNHYNQIPQNNAGLDQRLRPNGNLQNLNMTEQEIEDVVAFMKTLSGEGVYTNEKWATPFVN